MNGARLQIQRDETSFGIDDNHEGKTTYLWLWIQHLCLVHYFHVMKIFMMYAIHRPVWEIENRISYISETLSEETVSFVERAIFKYQENVESDKTRRR